MPGGAHENMRGWSPEEDELLLHLIASSGKRWKLIAEALGAHSPGLERTPAMVRNRYLRIERGRLLTEQGKSKNRCGQCGQLKRGHVCQAPRALVSTSFQAQEARHEAARLSSIAMPSTSYDIATGSSPMIVAGDGVTAASGTPLGVAAPPALRSQCSMQLLLQATEMSTEMGASDCPSDAVEAFVADDAADCAAKPVLAAAPPAPAVPTAMAPCHPAEMPPLSSPVALVPPPTYRSLGALGVEVAQSSSGPAITNLENHVSKERIGIPGSGIPGDNPDVVSQDSQDSKRTDFETV